MKEKLVEILVNKTIDIKINMNRMIGEEEEQIEGVIKTAEIMINIMIIEKIHEKLTIRNIGEEADHQVPVKIQVHQSQKSNYVIYLKNEILLLFKN